MHETLRLVGITAEGDKCSFCHKERAPLILASLDYIEEYFSCSEHVGHGKLGDLVSVDY